MLAKEKPKTPSRDAGPCANRAMPCSGMIYYSDFFLVMVDCMVYNARLAITDWLAFVMRNPLDFSIQYPPRPEYFLENFATEPDEGPVRSSSPPELLYVHIPFCPSRCSYCVFATEPRVEPELMEQYVRAVLIEVQSNATLEEKSVRCLDVGGGTPTTLPPALLERLLRRLSSIGSCGTVAGRSIETTPGQLVSSPEKVRIIADNGFQRISMGVQTTSASALNAAHREQQWCHVAQASDLVRQAGIQRLSMDLIFGLPDQTAKDWDEDLRRVSSLRPDAIVTYDCLYRGQNQERTRAFTRPPSVEQMGEMYDLAYRHLIGEGYHTNYGSLNFSLRPNETGTSDYFERRLLWGDDYVGIGNYATSLLGNRWAFNIRDADEYIRTVLGGNSPIAYHYSLPPSEQYPKYLLYSLNYGKLIPARFRQLYGRTLTSVYDQELQFARSAGWIEFGGDEITLASGQFANLYLLRSLLYSDAAKRWLIARGKGEAAR